MMSNPDNTPYFVSWSGGKDSCLALFRAIKQYGTPACLLNMLTEDGSRSRSHGLMKSVLEKQAQLLHVPIHFYSTTWDNYEETFFNALCEFKQSGISMGVFSDIAHRQWVDEVCNAANIFSYEPLWEDTIENILQELLGECFVAKIIAINANCLSPDYLGRILDMDLLMEYASQGIDIAGEGGEYHTIVIDGPIFSEPLCLKENGRVLKDGYWFLDVACK